MPKNDFTRKWYILTPLQKLPNTVGDLSKIIVVKGFKKSPKVKNLPNWVTLVAVTCDYCEPLCFMHNWDRGASVLDVFECHSSAPIPQANFWLDHFFLGTNIFQIKTVITYYHRFQCPVRLVAISCKYVGETPLTFCNDFIVDIKIYFLVQWLWLSGRPIASNSRGQWFESSHWQKFILNIVNCQLHWKDENKEKVAGNGPFKKKYFL